VFLLGGLLALASAAQALVCATPGKDGVGANITGVVNTYYPGTASATAGSTSLSLGASQGAATQITAGDLLLVIQMQDATLNTANTNAYGTGTTTASGATAINAGKFEYVVATSGSNGTGTVTVRGDGTGGGLLNSYASSAYSTASGAKTFQVIRVPQYSSATLGAALTSPAWNGATGGVVAIDVAGALNLNGGAITATGLGFRGGGGRQLAGGTGGTGTDYRTLATNAFHGQKGESVAGTPRYLNNAGTLLDTAVEGYPNGSSARGAPGNAGGGGTDANPTANNQNSGGGGGAGGGVGGQGGNAWSSGTAIGGLGGTPAPFGVSQIVLGGGGGAGATNDGTGTPTAGFASSGAAGGGAVMVRAGTVAGTGTITANGAAANNTVLNDGSGGGGAGGSVLVVSPVALPASLTVTARGGTGGTNTGTNTGAGSPHGPGGGGGGGAVVLSGAAPIVSVTGGAAGTTFGGATFGAVAGGNGSAVTTATAAQVPGATITSVCLPSLSVTKATSTPSRVINTDSTASYTITLQNTGGGAVGVNVVDALPTPFTYDGAAITPVYSGGASGPATLTGTGTTTATFGTAGGTAANSFYIPTGGRVALPFTVNLGTAVTPGTYQNPASTTFSDPTRTGTQTATPGSSTPYTAGGPVAGSNYASASSTNEDVTVSTAPVVCSAMYVLSGGDYTTANNGTDIRRIDETTDTFGQLVTQIPSTTAGQFGYSATLAIGAGGTKVFAARDQDRALLVYDVASGVWTNGGTFTAGTTAARLVRMTAGPDGTGYAMDGAGSFYTFKQNGATYTIAGPSTLTVSPANAPTFGASGDFFADAQGRLFLLSSPGNVNYLDFFEINPLGNTASYLGRINDADINSATYGGYAVTANGIYGRSGTGRMIQIDLSNLSVTPIDAAETNTAGSTDLGSCYFPSYTRAITATKTAVKVAGSTGPDVRIGDTLEYTIVVRNGGTLTAGSVTFQDNIPAGTTYVAGSTTLNTVAVADAGGVMPFVQAGKSVGSPNQPDGVLLSDTTPAVTTDREATVKFRVTVNAGATSVSNQGTVGYLDGTAQTRQTDDPATSAPNDATVSVVNTPPTTSPVTNVVLLDTAAATVLNPNLSATDTDGTIASYTIVTLPAATSGMLSVNGAAVTAGQTFTAAQLGTLTFKPVAGFNGNASFTYTATDNQGGVSNTSTYTIPVNVAPVAVNDTGSTLANTPKTLSITGNDTDTAPGTINATTTLFATSGQPTGSTLSNGNRTIAVPNEGTYTLDNSGNVTFTPVSGYSGTTTAVKYTVQDNQGATSNVANITVTVTPVATNDAASTAPSTPVNIPVLNNDLGTGKVATSVVFPTTGQPTGSTVTNGGKTLTNADGVYTVKTDGTVDFTPTLGKTGTLTPVLYTFKDAAGQTSNTATITVTVSAIVPPTATNDSKTTPKNTAVTLEGSTNDTAGSLAIDTTSVVLTAGGTITNAGKTLTNAQGTYQVQTNGTVIFTPVATFAGTTTPVSYTVKDTSGATSNAATLTVTVTNQPPVANNVTNTLVVSTAAAATLNPGVSGTDADGTVVTYTVTTLPTAAMGTLYCNGTAIASVPSTCAPAQLSFKPNPAFDGNATFQYIVTDDNSATSNVATYTIPVNKPPVANNDSGATNPNVNVTFSVTGNDTDTAPGTVDVTSTAFDASSTGTISNGGKTLTITGQGVFTLDNTGKVTFAPAAGFNNGTSTAKYTVKDNQGATSNVATITVNVPASVDLAITKSGPAYFKPGDTLSYTLTVTNGGSAATGVTVTDTLPAGLTFTSASSGGTYNAGTGKASWTLGTVAGGSTTTLTLTGTAPLAASVETNSGPASLANTATTQGNETEVVTANNSSTTTAQLVYPKLSKRVRNVTQTGAFGTVGTGKPNEVLEYCIDFKNYGVAVASFVVSDTVPSNTTANLSSYGVGLGLQVVRGGVTTTRTSIGTDADGGSLSSAALSLDLGTLAAGESGSVCFQASIR